LCFSTASSRKAKEAASVNLQPLQSNLKVLQEQQTQLEHNMVWGLCIAKSECDGRMKLSGVVATQVRVVGFAGFGAEILRFAEDDKNDVV
jgi:hypothetical protein